MDDKIKPRPWWCPDIREILALVIVLGGGFILYTKPDLESAMTLLLGTVAGYYFGSSDSSKKKTELLAKANPVEDGEHKCCKE